MGVFELHKAQSIVWVLGWRPKHEYHPTPHDSKGVFGHLGWGCLDSTRLKLLFGLWGGATNTNTTALHRAAKEFLDTSDGGV